MTAAAVAAMSRAYAPYSNYQVGAAALVDDGRVVSGCNVENASYGLTLCAECGLVSALHAGGGGRLVAVVVRGRRRFDAGPVRAMPAAAARSTAAADLQVRRPASGVVARTLERAAAGSPGRSDRGHPTCSTAGGSGRAVWSDQVSRVGVMTSEQPEPFDAVSPSSPPSATGGALTDAQVDWVLDAYVRGAVADYQMSALLDGGAAATGITPGELTRWTAAMIASAASGSTCRGARSPDGRQALHRRRRRQGLPAVLAPLVAACGAAVPQLSGRGLGHTGGTLDKMEAIPGWRASLSATTSCVAQLRRRRRRHVPRPVTGLVPADRLLYALRDVTATVESVPLIASSIMSKKIAEGTSALVLDVKVGTGAFMKNVDDARSLARAMVELGTAHGVRTSALLTDMSTPLGRTAGNALEVTESLEVLAGGGPADVVELTLALAREMLTAAGLDDEDPADALRDGRAMDSWRAMIRAQGGDPDAPLAVAAETHVIRATANGLLTRLDALAVGVAAWRLGAGRARKEDAVSAAAGVVMLAKPGDAVRIGQPVLELHTDDPGRFARAEAALADAIDIGETFSATPLIRDRVSS